MIWITLFTVACLLFWFRKSGPVVRAFDLISYGMDWVFFVVLELCTTHYGKVMEAGVAGWLITLATYMRDPRVAVAGLLEQQSGISFEILSVTMISTGVVQLATLLAIFLTTAMRWFGLRKKNRVLKKGFDPKMWRLALLVLAFMQFAAYAMIRRGALITTFFLTTVLLMTSFSSMIRIIGQMLNLTTADGRNNRRFPHQRVKGVGPGAGGCLPVSMEVLQTEKSGENREGFNAISVQTGAAQ